jgi:hypothetical protein
MRVACVSEGETEYACVPKLVGRMGHQVVHNSCLYGCNADWEKTIESQVLPQVRTAALKNPDKILIVVDRERHDRCCPQLAAQAAEIVSQGLHASNLTGDVSIVVSDRVFEVIVMADYDLVDRLGIFTHPTTETLGPELDGKNPVSLVREIMKPGCKYDKKKHGAALASKMRIADQTVLARSRSLRRLLSVLETVKPLGSG